MHYRNRRANGMGADGEAAARMLAAELAQTDETTEDGELRGGAVRAPRSERTQNSDFALMQALYGGTAKKLLPYIKKAVAENCYEGSPILRDIGPDRTSLDKIINEVMDSAGDEFDGLEEICLKNDTEEWADMRLLYDLTEALVLSEVFLNKRLKDGLKIKNAQFEG